MDSLTLTEVQREIMLRQLERELKEVELRKLEIEDLIKKLRGYNVEAKSTVKVSRDFTWKHMCVDILKDADDVLRTDDVYLKFIEKHPEFKSESRKSIISSISGSLSQLATAGKIVKVDNPKGTGNYWGLEQWFLHGSPMPDYLDKFKSKGLNFPPFQV